MKIKTNMYYIGKKFVDNSGKSREDGTAKTSYYLVRMEDDSENLYEWYVPKNQNFEVLVDVLEKAKKFTEYQVLLELSSYQGKPRIDLVGMAK